MMELVERAGLLALLQSKFDAVEGGEGHCILVSGEAGIGKSSLVKAFCRDRKKDSNIYQGTCDALFTPRPLAPLYDIIWQMGSDIRENSESTADRAWLFSRFFHELSRQEGTTLIVFEDVHWADEATLDLIKFLARRIAQIPCLFILTYRDDEIHSHHPLRNVLGQLPPDSFTRLPLPPLSKQAVEKLARERGYSGEDVYTISGGNPFYVNEILASYSTGVPDNIKDAVLSVYNRQTGNTKEVWEILSVLPTGFEVGYLARMAPFYIEAIKNCLEAMILIEKNGQIFFKHELYRRTIESSLTPPVRISLNRRILDMFLESFLKNGEVERIVHHAQEAGDHEMVVQYAPAAAKQAARVGAHIEASRLYFTAIDYYRGDDKAIMISLYEAYAYECYLIFRIREAITYQEKVLQLRKEEGDRENTGNCMRFLSRLWWYHGNRKEAEGYGLAAIEALKNEPSSRAKAMALSNMSQLKMLSYEPDECLLWGEKAIAMAIELGDQEILSHALNNVGAAKMKLPLLQQEGIAMLQESLAIALKHGFHEHAARAYTNLGTFSVTVREYVLAAGILDEGIHYCEARDLDSWTTYMQGFRARMQLEAGRWEEAYRTAKNLIDNENQSPIVKIGALTIVATINMRRGNGEVLPLLQEAWEMAWSTMEVQRITPPLTALLEYEWLTGIGVVDGGQLEQAIAMITKHSRPVEYSSCTLWLMKARAQRMPGGNLFEGYPLHNAGMALKAAGVWEQLGCPYEHALALFEGDEERKKTAIAMVQQLGAEAVYEKLKQEMRLSGIRKIPRGIRKTTRSNPAFLTDRELDVLLLVKEGMQNKEIASRLFISAKTVDHHISAILFKLNSSSRMKAVQEALRLEIIQ